MRLLLSVDVQKQNSLEQKRAIKFHQTILELGFKQIHSSLYLLDFAENIDLSMIIFELEKATPPRGIYVLNYVAPRLIGNVAIPKQTTTIWL
ncbi:MAG: hypothetical protein LBT37_05085 [Lactobacillaceae bacterium]|jgi:CRISPR/Cas system-associated protein endoribonuclease Cas2|nr:hypothetical protein [Lactobacillaceae bacterium]